MSQTLLVESILPNFVRQAKRCRRTAFGKKNFRSILPTKFEPNLSAEICQMPFAVHPISAPKKLFILFADFPAVCKKKPRGSRVCWWNWPLPSISSTFYVRVFRMKVCSKPNSKQRKDFRTKNVRVKCWWNWPLEGCVFETPALKWTPTRDRKIKLLSC